MVAVLLAVKSLHLAKQRLTELSDSRRSEVVRAMLADVLAAATGASGVTAITVVSPDPAIHELAERHGARVLIERSGSSDPLNAAYRAAARGAHAAEVLALTADLPAVTSTHLDAVIDMARALPAARAFVADHTGSGTTALYADGIDLDPRFGPDSAARHRESGAVELTGDWPGLRLDVDTLADLRRAVDLGLGTASQAALSGLGNANVHVPIPPTG